MIRSRGRSSSFGRRSIDKPRCCSRRGSTKRGAVQGGLCGRRAQTTLPSPTRADFLASTKIAIDETVVPVLDPGRGRTKKGYFWAIAQDDRPWSGSDPPAVAYSYAPGRGAIHALKLFERTSSRHRTMRWICSLQERRHAFGPQGLYIIRYMVFCEKFVH